jgi:hypothetical protein
VFQVRVFRVGDDTCVVALRGALDLTSAGEVVAEIDRHGHGRHVIVDLLRAHVGEPTALDALAATTGPRTTFVAERPILDTLRRAAVRTAPTLDAALF